MIEFAYFTFHINFIHVMYLQNKEQLDIIRFSGSMLRVIKHKYSLFIM